MELVIGEYFMVIEDDMLLFVDYFECIINVLNKNKDVLIVYFMYMEIEIEEMLSKNFFYYESWIYCFD